MKLFREFVEKKDANELFSTLFGARDHAHELHLATKSYAQHKALNSFYDSLLELTDQIIETYQGEYDLVKISPKQDFAEDPETFLNDLAKYIKQKRNIFEGDDHLQNIMDEISSLIYQTVYKIRFLK